MKTSLCLLLSILGLWQIRGQGTLRFSNVAAELSSPPDRLVRFDPVTVGTNPLYNPFGTNNAPVVSFGGGVYRAQLYYGSSTATEDSLAPVSTAPSQFLYSTNTIFVPGTWVPGTRTLNGFQPGDTVNLQVRVWDETYASSWEEYLNVRQGLAGKSMIFTHFICSDICDWPNAFAMLNFQGFTIGTPIPEPSPASLFVLGTFALVAFRKFVQNKHSKTPRPLNCGSNCW